MTPSTVHTTALKGLTRTHSGKVRDIYAIDADKLLIVTSDRLSAFDVILPDPIPDKGKVLTELAGFWFDKLAHILPNQLTGMSNTIPVGADFLLHGAGYLPELDLTALTPAAVTGDGKYRWTMEGSGWQPEPAPVDGGAPALPIKSPVLPIKSPVLPSKIGLLSTFALGQALKEAQCSGADKVAVIHFNNCFNFSLELLHTSAPYAEYVAGYPSYNFFTAGASYPAVSERLKKKAVIIGCTGYPSRRSIRATPGHEPSAGPESTNIAEAPRMLNASSSASLCISVQNILFAVSYTHLRAHETVLDLVCRLLLEKKNTHKENRTIVI